MKPAGESERGGIEPGRAVARHVPAGLAPGAHAELGPGQAEQLELAVVGVARIVVAHPRERDPCTVRRAQQGSLHTRARRPGGRAQPEGPVAADLVQGQGEAQPRAPAACPCPASDRQRAQVVRRAGVQALLRAGGHEPHVAAGTETAEPPGQRGEHARPEALSFAPGAPGAESVCAITIRRQERGVSSTPITFLERPSRRPGTRKRWTPTRRPACLNVRAM